jgi:hypothetical protein
MLRRSQRRIIEEESDFSSGSEVESSGDKFPDVLNEEEEEIFGEVFDAEVVNEN